MTDFTEPPQWGPPPIQFETYSEATRINHALASADPLGELCKLQFSQAVATALVHVLVGETVALRKRLEELERKQSEREKP